MAAPGPHRVVAGHAPRSVARHVEQFATGVDDLLLHDDSRPVRRRHFAQVWDVLRRRAELDDVKWLYGFSAATTHMAKNCEPPP